MIVALLLLNAAAAPMFGQGQSGQSDGDKIAAVKALYDGGRWEEVLSATQSAPAKPGDFGLYRGLALAHLERWDEAQKAFEAALTRNPGDTRLMVELGGLAYRAKDFRKAKRYLRRALRLTPSDEYSINLLASIYFLEGNLDAALKYWNRAQKPKLADLTFEPQPRLKPILLDRAFAFSRGSVWSWSSYLTSKARLEALDVFQVQRFDLEANTGDTFNLAYRATEKPRWHDSPWMAGANALSGLPYQTVFADFPNLNASGAEWNSSFRWDDEKRRITSEFAAPWNDNLAWRYRLWLDARNENWNLTNTLMPPTVSAAAVNLEKFAAGAELRAIPSGEWDWCAGVVYAYRRMRNELGLPVGAAPFFTGGSNLGLRGSVRRMLIRHPERRFTLEARATSEAGTFFATPLGRYFNMAAGLDTRWLPRSRGDDYETHVQLRAGRTFGDVPFDELYVLGFDRDTDLWMRGHPGLLSGEKGNAPMGRGYVLTNAEFDKVLYSLPFVRFRLGPFLDTGKTYDPSGFFGAQKWMWDTGAQLKIQVLGSFEFVLGYGKDLRSGKNSFFTTVVR